MHTMERDSTSRLAHSLWNWKCALLSAAMRSAVYASAMARGTAHGRLAVVLVEVAYVTLTAGLWAGAQQQALRLQRRVAGNLIVVVLVPGLAQLCDLAVHNLCGARAPEKAAVVVCVFTLLSALFHLYVMRRGAFLSGQGRSLGEDFRCMPRLLMGFVLQPARAMAGQAQRLLPWLDPRRNASSAGADRFAWMNLLFGRRIHE